MIAEKENLKVSDEEYKKGLEEYATQYGYTDSAELEDAVGKKEVKRALLQDKVTDWLVDNCKLVEKDSKILKNEGIVETQSLLIIVNFAGFAFDIDRGSFRSLF